MGQHDDLIQIFIEESRDYIDLLDQAIVKFENEPDNKALFDEIFRAFHTLKGNAGLVGMKKFEKIAHVTEEILTDIRDGKIEISADIITFLLDSLDRLKILHEAIEEHETDAGENIDSPETPVVPSKSTAGAEAEDAPPAAPAEQAQAPAEEKANNKEETPDEIVAEDGSWGIFPENQPGAQKAGDAPEEIVAADGSWGLFTENLPQKDAEKPAPAASAEETNSGPTQNETSQGANGQARNGTSQKTDVSSKWNKAESAIRVDVGLLDKMMNLVGELVLARNQIVQFSTSQENANFHATTQRLNLVTSELQESVMKTRMQPIGNVFNRFPRVVRDVARDTGKRVALKIEGQETELDKTIIEGIRDPLTHLVRNAIDHGLEDPETRSNLRKDPQGTLILRAYHEGGQVNIEIIDDGRGIDPEKIRNKAVEKGLLSFDQAKNLSDRDAINLIFRAGFSTAEKVTNISGRGVGMDVVKTNIEKIGGTVEIISNPGKGTTVKIKIPLTLAIIPALVVTAGTQRFAIPQINLLELVSLEGDDVHAIENMGDAEIYRLRGKLLPIIRLKNILKLDDDEENKKDEAVNIVVLGADDTQFGLVVDLIHDTEEIVVKPLDKHLKEIGSFAGATVMGDGKVALILDVVGLAETARVALEKNQSFVEAKENGEVGNEYSHTLLLFSVDDDDQYALPLSLVSRLETFPASAVEQAGNREVIQYRGTIMPLLRLENHLPIRPMPQKDTISVLTFTVDKNDVGFVVNEILDVIETNEKVNSSALQQTGILGTIIIDGKITLMIDAFRIIQSEFPEWFNRKGDGIVKSRPRILVVDDSHFIRATHRAYLESVGYQVIEASDGEDALEKLSAEDVDFIITDIEMPKMNGLELGRNIRANKKFGHIPIIAVSSLNDPESIRASQEIGIDDYLIKLNREEILNSIQNLLESSETVAA